MPSAGGELVRLLGAHNDGVWPENWVWLHSQRFVRPAQVGENQLQMPKVLDPFRFLLIALSGWMNQHQQRIIEYLREENRVLREQLGGRRVRLNDDQRRRLAVKAKGLGRKLLAEVATIVTSERSRKTTWKAFLERHWEGIVATDFFTVEVWT